MGAQFYRFGRLACRLIKVQCIREFVVARERAERSGGFLLACTHLSHLEPFIVGSIVRRPVRWMARLEFFRPRWARMVLNWGGAFSVDRNGFSLPAVRTGVRLVRAGHSVGVSPEGGVAQGARSVIRGAPFKHGVCTIAIQARAPIIPVVVLGSEALNRVGPWLPFRRGRLWVAFGREVMPPPRTASRRADRMELAGRLGDEFVRTYKRLLNESGLRDEMIP